MPKIRYQQLPEEEKNELLKKFYTAIASLNSYIEISNFFKDLLQADETVMLARRLKVAQLLEEGHTYEDISKKMGVGYDTISRVNHWRQYGRKGYQNVVENLKRLEKREEGRRIHREKLYDQFSWASFEKKYNLTNQESIDETIFQLQNLANKLKKKRSLKKALRKIQKK